MTKEELKAEFEKMRSEERVIALAAAIVLVERGTADGDELETARTTIELLRQPEYSLAG